MCVKRIPAEAPNKRRSAGVTLIELLVFIMIVGVALAGVLTSLNVANRASADPLRPKQALAIAESMLTEVMAKDYCDPDANGTKNNNDDDTPGKLPICGTNVREATRKDYDAIDDYSGFHLDNASSPTGDHVIAGYAVDIAVSDVVLNPENVAAKQVRVTVTPSGGHPIQLTAYRANY